MAKSALLPLQAAVRGEKEDTRIACRMIVGSSAQTASRATKVTALISGRSRHRVAGTLEDASGPCWNLSATGNGMKWHEMAIQCHSPSS